MSRPPAADALHLAVDNDPSQPRLHIEVNGQDINESQQPPGHGGTPLRFEPPPCKDVLPPDAVGLLPTTRPTQALIAVCTCGEAGCNSLWITVRRDEARVVWEPDPATPRRTIDRSWVFELQPYLDQIDTSVVDYNRVQPRGHSIARELRRRQGSLLGFGMGTREHSYQLCAAFPGWLTHGSSYETALGIEVAGPDGIAWYTVPLPSDRTDNDILDELGSFHPELYQQNGLLPWVRHYPDPSRPSNDSRDDPSATGETPR